MGYDGSSVPPNATGMMASLVGQLLSQLQSQVQRPKVRSLPLDDTDRIRDGDVKLLCDVFRELVLQLPKDQILVCILDEVCLYESEDVYGNIDMAIRELLQVIRSTQHAVFKLLVACYGHSLKVYRHFDEDGILDLGNILKHILQAFGV